MARILRPFGKRLHMDQIKEFFQAYEQRFNDGVQGRNEDPKAMAEAFADYFVESSARGVMGGKNDESFLKAVPEGNAFYRKIGTKRMRVAGLDVTRINAQHFLVKVHWDSAYGKDGLTIEIEFDVWYLLTSASGALKIFAYVTGDEQKVLREHGLIPEN